MDDGVINGGANVIDTVLKAVTVSPKAVTADPKVATSDPKVATAESKVKVVSITMANFLHRSRIPDYLYRFDLVAVHLLNN